MKKCAWMHEALAQKQICNETQALGSAFPFLEAQEEPWLLWQTQCPGGT